MLRPHPLERSPRYGNRKALRCVALPPTTIGWAMSEQSDSFAFWGGPEAPSFYGGQEPEALDDPTSRAVELLTQYMVPKGDGSDPTAEQVGVALSLVAGLSADSFDVGSMDEVDAELERLTWSAGASEGEAG